MSLVPVSTVLGEHCHALSRRHSPSAAVEQPGDGCEVNTATGLLTNQLLACCLLVSVYVFLRVRLCEHTKRNFPLKSIFATTLSSAFDGGVLAVVDQLRLKTSQSPSTLAVESARLPIS